MFIYDFCNYENLKTNKKLKDIILKDRIDIFDFDYKFYGKEDELLGEQLKREFESEFIHHFYFHNIGVTDVEEFKHNLKDILNTEYPKYAHMYFTMLQAKKLQWWNNKDFMSEIKRELDKSLRLQENKSSSSDNTTRGTSNGTDSSTSTYTGSDTSKVDNTTSRDFSNSNNTDTTNNVSTDTTNTGESNVTNKEDFTENSKKASTSKETNNSVTTENHSNEIRFSDTPQGDASSISKYLTNVTLDNKTHTVASEGGNNGTNESTNENKTNSNKEEVTSNNNTSNVVEEGSSNINSVIKEQGKETYESSQKVDTQNSTSVKNNQTINLDSSTSIENTETNNEEQVGKDVETITTIEKGNIGVTSSGELVVSWLRDGLINIHKEIFKDCIELFELIY